MKIRGTTISTPMPRPDWDQTNPKKADYIKNKPTDYVLSQGKTEDGWTYRQLASGLAECWITMEAQPLEEGMVVQLPFGIKSLNIFKSTDGTTDYNNKVILFDAIAVGYSFEEEYVTSLYVAVRCINLSNLSIVGAPTSSTLHVYITGEWKDLINAGGDNYPIWEGGLY